MQFERQALFWTAIALLLAYLVQLLAPVLLPFVLGLTLAYFFNPIVDLLGRIGLPRWASALLLLAISTCLIVIALIFVVPILLQQAAGLIEAAPREIGRLRAFIDESAREHFGGRYPQAGATIRTALDAFSGAIPSLLAEVAASLWNKGFAAISFISILLVTPIVFFYALIDWPKMVAKLDSYLPRDSADQIRELATEIDARVSAFIRGQSAVCLILAVFYAAGLSLAGLQYGLLVGSLSGLASFIPIFGWTLGTITATVLAASQFWPDLWQIGIVLGVMLAGQALESGILTPNIIGSEIGLHLVWVIFALLSFSYLFGFLGLLVAVPVSAAIGVLVRFALRTYFQSSLYQGSESAKG
jgi:predicted PurR-regulated permease PerM